MLTRRAQVPRLFAVQRGQKRQELVAILSERVAVFVLVRK